LSAQEQRLFRRLCVFVGGCTLEADETVCNAPGDLGLSVLDGVASLIDKSLLHQAEQGEHEPRIVMLETVREYGLECLVSSGEAIAMQSAHGGYYLALAEQAEPYLITTGQSLWLERLEQEYTNLRTACQWLMEQARGARSSDRGAKSIGAGISHQCGLQGIGAGKSARRGWDAYRLAR